jgi:hypothetical protein
MFNLQSSDVIKFVVQSFDVGSFDVGSFDVGLFDIQLLYQINHLNGFIAPFTFT